MNDGDCQPGAARKKRALPPATLYDTFGVSSVLLRPSPQYLVAAAPTPTLVSRFMITTTFGWEL